MANFQSDVPLVNSPFVDPRGNITEQWLLFLIQLWRRTGGSTGDGTLTLADVFATEGIFASAVPPIDKAALLADPRFGMPSAQVALPEMVSAPQAKTSSAQAPSSVALSGSPYTYTAGMRCALHVTGGTVSAISYKRGTSTLALAYAPTGQLYELSPQDQLTITYSAAPTVTLLPR